MTESDLLLLQVALDGEMDAPSFAALEARLRSEPELAATYAQLRALRRGMRAIPVPRATDVFRAKISALGATPTSARSAWPTSHWRAIAASFVMLGIGLVAGWTAAPGRPDLEQEVLAGHLRGMISNRPVDVISTDQHTVKPWFAGKLAVAPAVPDLSAQGYGLEGGRIDVVEGQAAATLVYRMGNHVLSVTRLPVAGVRTPIRMTDREINGYVVVLWSQGGVTYVATSDASRDKLSAFAKTFSAAMEGHE